MFSRKSAISKRTNSWLCCIYSYLWRPPVTRALCGLLSTEFPTSICSPTNTEYKITKLKMHKYKMTETKSYTISVAGALWRGSFYPQNFQVQFAFQQTPPPFPSITTTYFTITKAYINPIFTLQLAFFMTMSQCQICTNESYSTKKEPKVKAKCSITPPYGINLPLNCCWKSTLSYIPFIGWSFLHDSDMRISCGFLKREAVALKGFARRWGRVGGEHPSMGVQGKS